MLHAYLPLSLMSLLLLFIALHLALVRLYNGSRNVWLRLGLLIAAVIFLFLMAALFGLSNEPLWPIHWIDSTPSLDTSPASERPCQP